MANGIFLRHPGCMQLDLQHWYIAMLVVSVNQYISLLLFWAGRKTKQKRGLYIDLPSTHSYALKYISYMKLSSLCCVISLGARHDGDGNDCLGSSQYIMSAGNSPTTEANAGNAWIFSNCSLNYFQTTIQALDKWDIRLTILHYRYFSSPFRTLLSVFWNQP